MEAASANNQKLVKFLMEQKAKAPDQGKLPSTPQ